ATDLAAGTRYYYRFAAPDGAVSPVGTCKTAYAPDQRAPLTFGFSGDVDWRWKPYPLLHGLNREPLDFFVFLGDLIYEWMVVDESRVAETLDDYRLRYRDNREPRPGVPGVAPLQETYGQFGHYSVFDNHELGLSLADPTAPPYYDGGAPVADGQQAFVNQTPGFRDRLQAYAEYQPVRVGASGDPPRGAVPDRFYYAQQWGADAILVVVDDRSYRGVRLRTSDEPEADSPDRTMLGPAQLAWLQDTLLEAQRRGITWKFVVISSPIQEIGRASEVGVDLDGTKSWAGGYRYERDRLLQFVDQQ